MRAQLTKALFGLAVTIAVAANAGATEYFVAANASWNGDGSYNNPWRLDVVLAPAPAIHPGDTIWVRGGTYRPTSDAYISRLKGTATQPIIVRNYKGERAILDGFGCEFTLMVEGVYTYFWGLEVMDSNWSRYVSTPGSDAHPNAYGVAAYGKGNKFINMIVHDTSQGLTGYDAAPDTEFYGNIVYYNGWMASDRNHGHGVYAQNQTGTKLIDDNIVGDNFCEGMQIYGSGNAHVTGFRIRGNALYNTASIPYPYFQYNMVIAGGNQRYDIQVRNNYSYFTPELDQGYNYLGQYTNGQDMIVTDNVFVGGYETLGVEGEGGPFVFTGNKLYLRPSALRQVYLAPGPGQGISTYTWNSNNYFGMNKFYYGGSYSDFAGWKARTGFDSNSTQTSNAPTGAWVYVRPNRYEAKRANVIIYNWDLASSVAVDLSGVLSPGDSFVIRDSQNFFGNPMVSGVYAGGTVAIPMTPKGKSAPVGVAAPAHTLPRYGTFVVLGPSSDISTPPSGTPIDTMPPAVTMTAPADSATVSGTIAVTATASDTFGVVGVQFKLDGANFGAEFTALPYTMSWDTTKVTDSAHTLTAVARDAAGNSSTSAVTVVVKNCASCFFPIRVNSGGLLYTDPLGQVWTGDTGYNAGRAWNAGVAVAGTTSQPLYQTERFELTPFQYQFAVPNGTYSVNLKFAENYADGSGQRKFNVNINGQGALANFDIFAQAGGASKAVDRSTVVAVTGGQIVIQFVPVVGAAKINAIEIVTSTGTPTPPVTTPPAGGDTTPPAVSLASPTVGSTVAGSVTVTATASDNVGVAGVQFKLDGANLGPEDTAAPFTASWDTTTAADGAHTITAVARDAAGNTTTSSSVAVTVKNCTNCFTPIRLRAGASAYTDPQGVAWSADNGYSGGSTWSTGAVISGTSTPALYQAERWNLGALTYQFTVPNGNYSVNLKFAENFADAAGQRIFNVNINGQPALTNFDIFAQAGGGTRAVDRATVVTVATGKIVIDLVPIVGAVKINALEIVSSSGGTTPPVAVSVSPLAPSLSAGQTQVFTATVTGSSDTSVTWSLGSAVGTLVSTGPTTALYTAPASIATAQSVTVTAKANADNSKTASATVALQATPPPATVAVSVGPLAATLSTGQTQVFTATVTGSSDTSVTWSLGSAVGTLVSTGPTTALYTAPASIATAQNLAVIAKASADNAKTASATVTLQPPAPVTVGVSPASATLTVSQTRQFSATLTGSANTSVTWSLSPAIGTVSTTGLYTAPASIATAQNVTVTATCNADSSKSANAVVTLQVPPPVTIVISQATATLTPSQTLQFTATVSNAANTSVTWSLSSPFGTVSPTGVYTAPATISSALSVTLTATSNADATKSASAAIALQPAPLNVSVVLNPPAATLAAAQSQQFTATVTGAADTSVSWSLGAPVGSISPTGKYTAPTAIAAAQTVTVIATSIANPGRSASATVTLQAAAAGPVMAPIRVNAGGAAYTDPQGRAWAADYGYDSGNAYSTGTPVNGTNAQPLYQTERWSSDPFQYQFAVPNGSYGVTLKFSENYCNGPGQRVFNVAINGQQVLTSFDIFAQLHGNFMVVDRTVAAIVSNGKLVIRFIPVGGSAKIGAIEIIQGMPVSADVQPSSATLGPGQTRQFSANVLGATDNTVRWSVDSVGTISPSGLYTAPAAIGSTQTVNLTATPNADPTRPTTVRITLIPMSVSISPSTVGLAASKTQQFSTLVLGADNTSVAWTLTGAGGLSPTGLYTAPPLIPGAQTATVTVKSNADPSKSASAIIALQPAVVVASPTAVALGGTKTQQFSAVVTNSDDVSVKWSMNPQVGTLSASGLYTAPAAIFSDQTVTVTATSNFDPTKSSSVVVTLQAGPGVGFRPIRVNSGGPAYTDQFGQLWAADYNYSGGNTYTSGNSIPGTPSQMLYQSERWDSNYLKYAFNVPNGFYHVNLKFAENWETAPGRRVFNVKVNGQLALTNFDIFAQAGGQSKAVDRATTVSVTNGQIAIEFFTVRGSVKIDALEIY